MKRAWLAGLVLMLGILPAKADVVWQGEAVIDTATAQCGAEKSIAPKPGRVLKTVLRPLGLSTNGVNTTVVFIANQMAVFAMVLDHGAMPAGTAAAFGHNGSGVIKTNVGTTYTNFAQSPATVAIDTMDVTLSGAIDGFLYVPGCTVTFRAAYTKRND